MKKTITVAIPVYNGEDFLAEAIQSIIDQTYKVDEILICDNQSNDNTVHIIKKFIDDHPEFNFQFHQNDVNIGAMPNFNKCQDLCKTDFLLLLGSDDALKPNAIKEYMRFLEQNPEVELVGGYTDLMNEKGEVVYETSNCKKSKFQKGQFLEYIKDTNLFMQHSTVVLSKKIIDKLGDRDEICIGGDERYYAKALSYFPIARIGKSLVYQKIHSGQVVRNENADFKGRVKHFEENSKIAEFESDSERRKQSKKFMKNWVSDFCRAIIKLELQDGGNVSLATKYWIYGITHNPSYFAYVYSRKAKHGIQKIFGIKY